MINTIDHAINIDLSKKINMNQTICIKENDNNSHKFLINILNNGLVYDLTGTTSRIYFLKKDGTKVFLNCTLDNALSGKISCLLTTQALTCAGPVSTEVTIYGTAGEILTSVTFNFVVLSGVRDDAAIESTSEFTALTNALVQVNNWDAQFQTKYDGLEAQYAIDLTEVKTSQAEMAYLPSSFYQVGDIDDTASINRALAFVNTLGGGKVRIPFRATPYIISSELIIYSNTTLEVDTFATIKLANNSNCVMLWNANKSTIASPARIDKNIKIIGGIWDGNGANQSLKWYGTQNTSQLVVGIFFSGVDHLIFKPTKIIKTKSYACLICNVNNLLIENVEVNVDLQAGNEDGIHILGPSENIKILNCKIRSQDNFIAINANDVMHGPYTTFGAIDNVKIDKINVNNYDGGQGMLILSGTYPVTNVTVTNITGTASYLTNIHTFDFGDGDFDNIKFDNCNIKKYGFAEYPFVNMFGKMGNVELKNIKLLDGGDLTITNRIQIHTTAGTPITYIENLTIENLTANGINISGADFFDLIQVTTGVTIKNFKLKGIQSENNTTPIIPLDISSATIKKLIISDMILDNTKYGMAYLYKPLIDYIYVENVRLGTKSVNVLWLDVDTATDIKSIVIQNCGNTFIREYDNIPSVSIINPEILTLIPTNVEDYYNKGRVIYSKDPATLGFAGWVCTIPGSKFNVNWSASTPYSVDSMVRIGSWVVKCIVAGTSGGTTPTVTEGDFADGTVKWRYIYNGIATFKTFGAVTP